MATRLVCADCGEGFDYEPAAFHATCPNCGRRYQPRAGCC